MILEVDLLCSREAEYYVFRELDKRPEFIKLCIAVVQQQAVMVLEVGGISRSSPSMRRKKRRKGRRMRRKKLKTIISLKACIPHITF